MEKIDHLDKKILSILSKNARIPFKDVAAECNVSRAAIYARDNEQLMDLLNGKLQSIHGVVATETLISLEQSIKREITVNLDEE